MAESKRESIGKIKIDLDVSDAITGLKAVQREAKAATKALAELREATEKTFKVKEETNNRDLPSVEDVYYGRVKPEAIKVVSSRLDDEQVDDLVGEYIQSKSAWIRSFLNKNGISIFEVDGGIRWVRVEGETPS